MSNTKSRIWLMIILALCQALSASLGIYVYAHPPPPPIPTSTTILELPGSWIISSWLTKAVVFLSLLFVLGLGT